MSRTRRSVALYAAGLVLSGALAACGRAGSGAPDPGALVTAGREAPVSRPPHFARQRVSSNGRFVVRYRPLPDPIPLNQTFDLEIAVADARDPSRAVPGVTVGINAEMTTHSHGMNVRPAVTPTGPGAFRVEGMTLHMLGRWTLHVDLTHAGITERAVFDVVL